MRLSFQLMLAITSCTPVGGIDPGGPCSSAEIDAAARQLLQRMVSSVTARLQSSERPADLPLKLNSVIDLADGRGGDPVEIWADTLREMHSKLAAAGFDFQPQQKQKLANSAASMNYEADVARDVRLATSSQKHSEVVFAKGAAMSPTASSVSDDDTAIAEAHTIDGVKRAMREEWGKATPFFLQATQANPLKVRAL